MAQASSPSVTLSSQPGTADTSATLVVRGKVGGTTAVAHLTARLELRGLRRWRTVARAAVGADRGFSLRWRAPTVSGYVPLRVVITAARGRRVAASRPWRVAVIAPGGGAFQQRPPVGGGSSPAPAPNPPSPPAPPVPPQTVFDAAALTLAAGTEEVVGLPLGVTVSEVDPAGVLIAGVENGALTLAATADPAAAHHDLALTARGCVEQQCGLDLTVRVAVDVVPFAAPPGPVSDFPSPSPDRLAAATSLPAGLPGQRLADELVVTLGSDESPGTRSDANAVAAAVDAVVTGGVDEVGVLSLGWTAPQDLATRRTELLAQAGVTAVSYRDLGTVGESAVPPGDWSDDGQDVIWPFTQIRAPEAWEYQQGGLLKVGIVDGARVQANHEDLNVVTQLGPKVWGAHATHVAGLACARANGIGVVGVAWDCPIVTSGIKSTSDEDVLAAATAVALEPGVKVVNMSLGPNLDTARCATAAEHQARMLEGEAHAAWFRRLFGFGVGKGIVWTIAAGNNCEDAVPSAWGQNGDLGNVIVVGATNSDRSLARFSTFGHDVEVAAPGGVDVLPPRNGTVGLWSTWLYGGTVSSRPECGPLYRYCWDSGTSMAAPMVAGVAELVRSAFPSYSAADVARCVVRTAFGDATQSAYPIQFTPQIPFGPEDGLPIVDAVAALKCKPGEFTVTIGDGELVEGELRKPLTVTLSAGGGRAPYKWSLDGYPGPIDGLSLSGAGVLSGTPTYAGPVPIPVVVTDAEGNVGHGTVNVRIAFGPAPPISGHATRLTGGNGDSRVAGISADGSSVLVSSEATNLTADPARSEPGADLFTIDTTSKEARRITHGTGATDSGLISADGSTVVFRSTATDLVPGVDPNGDEYDLYVWKRSSSAIKRIGPGDALVDTISDDGSKVLYTLSESGKPGFWIVSTATGAATQVATEPTLEYERHAALSGDGTKLLYRARPAGTNLVHYIHLRDLESGTDTNFGVQSADTLRFAADGTMAIYGTYNGIFNEGTGVLNLSSGQRTVLDGGVNGVFTARTSTSGNCIVLHSWENTALTSDLPNRGEQVYFDDLFSYNLQTQSYVRLTNTYIVDTGGAGVGVADDCSEVAFDVPPGALDPDRQDEYTPRDVFVRRP
jgi:hypothetical protein